MSGFCLGDIIKISDFSDRRFVIVSKNAFIQTTGKFHVCPLLKGMNPGMLHVSVKGEKGTEGVVVCEQIKLIDPSIRRCSVTDRIFYSDIMTISDAIQGIFEYD